MKLRIGAKDLSAALATVMPTANRVGRSTIPATTCVLLTAASGVLTLDTTNLERWAHYALTAGTVTDGAIAVSPKELNSIATAARGGIIELEATANALTATWPTGTAVLAGIGAEEFPFVAALEIKDMPNTVSTTLSPAMLTMLTERVAPATTKEDSRITFTGIHLDLHADGLFEAAGSDGYVLGVVQGVHRGSAATKIIIPASTITALHKALGRNSEHIAVNISQ